MIEVGTCLQAQKACALIYELFFSDQTLDKFIKLELKCCEIEELQGLLLINQTQCLVKKGFDQGGDQNANGHSLQNFRNHPLKNHPLMQDEQTSQKYSISFYSCTSTR